MNNEKGSELLLANKKFNVDNITIENWPGFKRCMKKPIVVHACQMDLEDGFEVTTFEGKLNGKPGDYLIIGINGEKYPIDKEIFLKTYNILDPIQLK